MAAAAARTSASCLFCKIIKGEIPSLKIAETELSYSFLDIGPLSKGHSLIVPKDHSEKLHDVPDAYLADALPLAKRIAKALNIENYNLLQNNGKIAHQVVPHVHFHIIPKPSASDEEGLGIRWPSKEANKEELNALLEEIKGRL